jgi:Protein of unknown function (FYDLN_acid)
MHGVAPHMCDKSPAPLLGGEARGSLPRASFNEFRDKPLLTLLAAHALSGCATAPPPPAYVGGPSSRHRIFNMTKPELGTKRRCNSCATKFFDLNKAPIV